MRRRTGRGFGKENINSEKRWSRASSLELPSSVVSISRQWTGSMSKNCCHKSLAVPSAVNISDIVYNGPPCVLPINGDEIREGASYLNHSEQQQIKREGDKHMLGLRRYRRPRLRLRSIIFSVLASLGITYAINKIRSKRAIKRQRRQYSQFHEPLPYTYA